MSRFPKLSETFILFEVLALQEQGIRIELYPLLRARNTAIQWDAASLWKKILERICRERGTMVMHQEAVPLVERAHFQPLLSWSILRAQFHFLLRRPRVYLGALWALLRGTWGSLNYSLGGLAIFPKTVYFARLMEADAITHVHAHYANHPAAAAFIIRRLTGIPYTFTAHGADLQVDQQMLREKVAEAACVVAISQYNKELIVKECGEEFRDKVEIVHCGVDTQVFQPRPQDASGQERGGLFTILCTGTLYEVKGQTHLVEACRLLKERGVEFACHFVGDGPDRQALTEQVLRAGLADHVSFHGPQTRDEISRLLKSTQVVAVPSVPTNSGRREGIPVVLMEAMARGVPVVASGISGIPELVEDEQNGLLVPPRDPQSLADALERLCVNPLLRRQLGRAGREKVLAEFDLHKNAATLAQFFTCHARS